jgi:site-specific recombinase XerD
MSRKPLPCSKIAASIPTVDISRYLKAWINDGRIAQLSPNTLSARSNAVERLQRFLNEQQFDDCSHLELREFFASLSNLRPQSVWTYYIKLTTFFNFLVEEDVLPASPMDRVPKPTFRQDQIQPFSPVECQALIAACALSSAPKRDLAIILLLLDTGLRASEIATARMVDLDLIGRRLSVVGKGNKRRSVYFGRSVAKALRQYLTSQDREDSDCTIFTSNGGHLRGEALTRSGILQIIEALGIHAGITASRVSPHTARHTFAITFLRNGGNVYSLKELLGHTDLRTSQKYLNLSQADLQSQHAQFSPVEKLKRAG